jgi:hypothetical protein
MQLLLVAVHSMNGTVTNDRHSLIANRIAAIAKVDPLKSKSALSATTSNSAPTASAAAASHGSHAVAAHGVHANPPKKFEALRKVS